MYLNINVFKTVKLMVTQKTKIMEYKDTKFKSYTFSTYVFNIVNWNQKTFTFNWLWIQTMRPDAFWRSTIPLKWNQRLHIIYVKTQVFAHETLPYLGPKIWNLVPFDIGHSWFRVYWLKIAPRRSHMWIEMSLVYRLIN